MTNVYPSIYDCQDAKPILCAVKAKKHLTISYKQYELLERIYIDHFFLCNPEIDRKKWTTWARVNEAKQTLKDQLKCEGFITLLPPAPIKLHPYESAKRGLTRVLAIEKKVKLWQKLMREKS